MNSAVLYHERLNFLSRGPALAILALLVLAFAYAGWSGDRWRDAQHESLAVFQSDAAHGMAEWREQLAGVEAGTIDPSPFDANPMEIMYAAVLAPGTLADFAVGHADLHPASAEISPWNDVSSVFGRYQFDNPTTLSASSFDVATVIVVLMPLFMIAISFDVLASERARGSLAMVLSVPISLTELVWTRLMFRNALIWLAAVAVMLVMGFVNDVGGDRFARMGIWLTVSLVYAMFWFGLIAFCVARCRSATATAGSLVGLWLLFTLALPATIATYAEAVYPTPSRLALLSEVRTAQAETERNLADLTDEFLTDHPELTVGDEGMPSFFRGAYLSNKAAREATRPIADAYDAARAGRERAVRWSQYLSPSIVAQRLLLLSAGADLERQHRFQSEVQSSLVELSDAIGPAVVSHNRLTLAEYDALKPFEFRDLSAQQIASRAIGPLIFLAVFGFALGFAAQRRLVDEHLYSQ